MIVCTERVSAVRNIVALKSVQRHVQCNKLFWWFARHGLLRIQKQRILHHYFAGNKAPTFAKLLSKENLHCMQKHVHDFLRRYEITGDVGRKSSSGGHTKITDEVKAFVKEQMQRDDETTAIELYDLLKSRWCNIHRRKILRCRTSLGFTFRGSAYCQLIRDVNKQKLMYH